MADEVVGRARVEVDLDTDQLAAEGRDAGEQAGEEYGEEFVRTADGRLRDSRGRFAREGSAIGDAMAGSLSRSMRRNNPFSGLEAQFELSQTRILASVARFGPLIAAGLGAAVAIGPAFAAALPAVAALGAAIGVIALSLDDLGKAFRPIERGFTRLQDVIGPILVDGIRPLVQELSGRLFPVLTTGLSTVATSMNRMLTDWLTWAGSARTLGELADLLAGVAPIMATLSGAAMDVASAFGTIAVAALPAFASAADAIADATAAFNAWIQALDRSGDLTTGISGSMGQLGSVLSDLGRVAGSALRLFDDLGPAGVAAFSGLADVVVGVLDGLRPLAQFLSQNAAAVRDFAVGVGAAVVALQGMRLAQLALTRLFAVNPFTLALGGIVGLAAATGNLNNLLGGLASLVSPIVDAFNALPGPFQAAALAAGGLALVAAQLGPALAGIGTAVSNAVLNLLTMPTAMRSAALATVAFRTAVGGVGIGLLALSTQVNESQRNLGILLTTLGGVATGFSVGGPWGAAIGGAAGLLLGLSGAMFQASGSSDQLSAAAQRQAEAWERAKQSIQTFRDTLNQLTGAFTRNTRVQVAQSLAQQDLSTGLSAIQELQRSGVNTQQALTGALNVGGKAWNRTIAALDRAEASGRISLDTQRELIRALANQGRAALTARADLLALNESLGRTNLTTREYRDLLNSVRPRVRTAIEQIGMDSSRADIRDLLEQYDATPKEIRTTMRALGFDTAREQAEGLKNSIESIPDRTVTVTTIFQTIGETIRGIFPANNMAGGIITKPTLSWLGEQSRKEAVVPVTMPKRAMKILEQSGGADIVRRHDAQAGGGKTTNIEIHPTVNNYAPGVDAETLVHQISNRITSRVVR